MCFHKWFRKPDTQPILNSARRALLFGINHYGGGSDLNGCLNDVEDMAKMIRENYPDADVRIFKDGQVTRAAFIANMEAAISSMKSGDSLLVHYSGHGTQVTDRHGDEEDGYDEALYLSDGTVIDDDVNASLQKIPEGALVVLMFDSCFSGTVTRGMNPVKGKYYLMPGQIMRNKKNIRIPRSQMKWVVFSGCAENQTSSDALINNRYNGAFTFYALKAFSPGITLTEWFLRIRKCLPSENFTQAPTLEGDSRLFTYKLFEK